MIGSMTIGEIESRFPESWILIDKPVTDDSGEVVGGCVVFVSHDRDEVYRHALNLPIPRDIAFHCTVKQKPGMAYVL